MVLIRSWLAAIAVVSIGFAGLVSIDPAAAQQYRADELLHLDLSRAVLSPRPLGPAAFFAPGPLDVTVDRGDNATQANAESVAEPKIENTEPKTEPKSVSTAVVHLESKSTTKTALKTAASRVRAAHAPRLVALDRRNPVEAQARETRIQVWPCKSGGICGWKR